MMDEVIKKQPSQWWWLDTNISLKRSPWLESTLDELNEKTKAMLGLIEPDADSFATRAEMYYKKRPELISMVEDFYRTHRSLAEHYDQVKSESGTRLLTSASAKYRSEMFSCFSDPGYDSHSEFCDEQDPPKSEVDDAEKEEQTKFDDCTKEKEVSVLAVSDELMRLREEMERLREENRSQKDQLHQKEYVNDEVSSLRAEIKALREKNMSLDAANEEVIRMRAELKKLREENSYQNDQLKQKEAVNDEVLRLSEEIKVLREENLAQKDTVRQKDEEKIEVIKQLSLAMDILKQENVKMRKIIAKGIKKLKNPFEFNKVMGVFSVKFLNGSSKNEPTVVAL